MGQLHKLTGQLMLRNTQIQQAQASSKFKQCIQAKRESCRSKAGRHMHNGGSSHVVVCSEAVSLSVAVRVASGFVMLLRFFSGLPLVSERLFLPTPRFFSDTGGCAKPSSASRSCLHTTSYLFEDICRADSRKQKGLCMIKIMLTVYFHAVRPSISLVYVKKRSDIEPT